jgi:hypothetical protein
MGLARGGPKNEMSFLSKLELVIRWIFLLFNIQQPTVVSQAGVDFVFKVTVKVSHV